MTSIDSHMHPPLLPATQDSVIYTAAGLRAVAGLTVDYAHKQLTGSLVADNTLMSGRAALPMYETIDSSSVYNNTLSVHIDRQLIGNNPDVDNVLMNNSVRPAPVDSERAVPVASRPMTSDYNYL